MRAWNLRLLARCDLGGRGNGGEGLGMTIQGSRRTLFVAHESGPANFTAVDVSDPRRPTVLSQVELPHSAVRSNSLSVCGDLLAVAHLVPDPPEGSPAGAIQMNDVYVDDRRIVHAVDRFTGGLMVTAPGRSVPQPAMWR